MTIRLYRPTDLPALHALDTLCFDPPFRFSRRATARFAEAPHAITLVAEEQQRANSEEVCGFCIVHLESDPQGQVHGYVVTLDIAPALRRKGLGSSLLHAAEEASRSAGACGMRLHVHTGNVAAMRLYERLGYQHSETEEDFYGAGLPAAVYRREWDPSAPVQNVEA